MNELFQNPLFGLTTTLLIYLFYDKFLIKLKIPIINPLIATIATIILLLEITGISYTDYNKGGQILSMLITPATVALAYPLYKNMALLKNYSFTILFAISIGAIANVTATCIAVTVFHLKKAFLFSLLPKSVTTAISLDLSNQLGGLTPVTLAIVVITGIFGALTSTTLFRWTKINHPVAKGLALGSTSHAIGTGRAIQMGKVEGIISGLAISINGIVTVLLLPWLFPLFEKLTY